MTRETKIGLLVGLAFIIVIGILLSDHIQSSTEPPAAKLADAGNNAQQAVNTLGANSTNASTPVTVVTPTNVAPQQQVPTTGDLNPRPQQPVTSVISVNPPASSNNPPVTIIQDQPKTPVAQTPPAPTPAAPTQVASAEPHAPQSAGADAPDAARTANGTLRELARQSGEDLVPVGPAGANLTASAGSGKSYKCEPGDTVSKMALKFFGANTKTARDAIVKANPSLHDNPDKVIVGKTYTIPADATVASATEPPATPKPAATETPAPTATNTNGAETWYTVKPGENLWRIAKEQCGNANAVTAIMELNKDTLKDPNSVRADMKLKLPSRPVASAN